MFTGVLGQVTQLQFLKDNQTLMWEEPFQLNTSESILFNINITKISEEPGVEFNAAAIEISNHTDTYLDLRGRMVEGSSYKASLRAVNVVGEGEEASLKFGEVVGKQVKCFIMLLERWCNTSYM